MGCVGAFGSTELSIYMFSQCMFVHANVRACESVYAHGVCVVKWAGLSISCGPAIHCSMNKWRATFSNFDRISLYLSVCAEGVSTN